MFIFFYHFAWTLFSLFFLPVIPFIKNQRFLERCGLSLPEKRPEKGGIWIHALSVGEVVSAVPLVESLKEKFPEKDIVFTVATIQGMEIAANEVKEKVNLLMTMPLDFWWSTRRVVSHIRPSIFILIETDIWPGLIFHLKRKGIKSILVNGRVSPRTFRRYRRFRFFIKAMLSAFEACLMQSDLDRNRLLYMGIAAEKVENTGNIKFDREWHSMEEKEYNHRFDILGLRTEDIIWVAGSTHEGEEDIILDVFGRLRALFPMLILIIAPRRIERSGYISRLSADKGFKTVLRSGPGFERGTFDVMILNSIGELERIYGIGKICFVGGSFPPIGGHNLLEPAFFGRPVLFGPHTHNFVLMSQLLIETGGGMRVRDGEDLFQAVKGLLSDPVKYESMGRKAKEFVEMNRGVLKRVTDQIEISL